MEDDGWSWEDVIGEPYRQAPRELAGAGEGKQ